jgi:hypothetical protein
MNLAKLMRQACAIGRRPYFNVAWGNAPGIYGVALFVWPKAIITPKVKLAFSQCVAWSIEP